MDYSSGKKKIICSILHQRLCGKVAGPPPCRRASTFSSPRRLSHLANGPSSSNQNFKIRSPYDVREPELESTTRPLLKSQPRPLHLYKVWVAKLWVIPTQQTNNTTYSRLLAEAALSSCLPQPKKILENLRTVFKLLERDLGHQHSSKA